MTTRHSNGRCKRRRAASACARATTRMVMLSSRPGASPQYYSWCCKASERYAIVRSHNTVDLVFSLVGFVPSGSLVVTRMGGPVKS